VQEDKPVCEVEVFDSGLNEIESIKVTLDHPFYVDRKGWTPAGELRFGYMLLGPGSWHLPIGKVEFNRERSTVYNMEVDEFHTYYVGKFGAWVHNTCGEITKLQQPLREITSEKPVTIYKLDEYPRPNTPAGKSPHAETGRLGEYYAKLVVEVQTGLKFLSEEMRNGGKNNGPDLWNLNEVPLANRRQPHHLLA
jgi:hypothetical protein